MSSDVRLDLLPRPHAHALQLVRMNWPGHLSALLASPEGLVLGLPSVTRYHPFASLLDGVMLAVCLRLGVFVCVRPGGRTNRPDIPGQSPLNPSSPVRFTLATAVRTSSHCHAFAASL